jgi:alkylglycerol monooxygenase
MMETYMIPLFILLMTAETVLLCNKQSEPLYLKKTLDNIGTGLIALLFDHGFSLLSYPLLLWIYRHSLFDIGKSPLYFCALFLLLDFTEYWFHRLSHRVPLMWTAHKVHHQSTVFNLSVGLRTSVLIPFFNVGFYALIPCLGFDPADLLFFIFMQGIYQLFIHTEVIKKLGVCDVIFVTPSVHRVHHGINEEYLDKNFGKIFVIWDHLFGTYEKEAEAVVYGASDPEGEHGLIRCQLVPVKKWWCKQFKRPLGNDALNP